MKPELIIKSELLRFLLLGAVSFVLETSFSKEVLVRVSGSMAAARLDKQNKEAVVAAILGKGIKEARGGVVSAGLLFFVHGRWQSIISAPCAATVRSMESNSR